MPATRASTRRKITFVAEQFAPPVVDGSTYVYKNWIDFLAERYELYAIFFTSYAQDASAAERYLAERCAAHLILPGASRRPLAKVARAAARFATGGILAPRWLEELGRARIHRTIAAFIARYGLDFFIVSKLVSAGLFGERNIRATRGTFLLDMHDDFVLRDRMERDALDRLLSRHPAMARYPGFRNLRLRQALSRLEPRRARAQEARICALFDGVLTSSLDEFRFYRTAPGFGSRCEHLGWPPRRGGAGPVSSERAAPSFDAGFIGGDHPFNVEALLFFLNEVLPLIRRHRPGFRFLVAGKAASPLALDGARWPGVTFFGYVPDVNVFYEQIKVGVVPILSGTGVSLKTIEALDFGRPVVATPKGVRGLPPFGEDAGLVVADNAADFAAATIRLLQRAPIVPLAAACGPGWEEFDERFRQLLERYEQHHGDAALPAPLAAEPILP
jgi:glycosyltransferase involved in cell wall biosynthesis